MAADCMYDGMYLDLKSPKLKCGSRSGPAMYFACPGIRTDGTQGKSLDYLASHSGQPVEEFATWLSKKVRDPVEGRKKGMHNLSRRNDKDYI